MKLEIYSLLEFHPWKKTQTYDKLEELEQWMKSETTQILFMDDVFAVVAVLVA